MITSIIGYVATAWFFMSLGVAFGQYLTERTRGASRVQARNSAIREFLIWPVYLYMYVRGS